MSDPARLIELPADLHAYAEEEVRLGRGLSVGDVVRGALEEKRRATTRAAIAAGLAELDAGLGVACTPDELMADIYREVGLPK